MALAAALGLSLLGMTYILFDPELGTAVPLFQEFTCKSELRVLATDPSGNETLRIPEMALRMRAFGDDAPRPAHFTIHKRERDEPWGIFYALPIQTGEHYIYVEPITAQTEIYVEAMDLEGVYCTGRSPVVRAIPTSSPAPAAGSP